MLSLYLQGIFVSTNNTNKIHAAMKKIKTKYLQGNKQNPEIELNNTGHLKIKGNSIDVNPQERYMPLINWISNFDGENLKIDINLKNINCSSVKMLQQLITAADKNKSIKNKLINWHINDTDQEELGDMISSNVQYSNFNMFHCN
jgi:hypothetical protein